MRTLTRPCVAVSSEAPDPIGFLEDQAFDWYSGDRQLSAVDRLHTDGRIGRGGGHSLLGIDRHPHPFSPGAVHEGGRGAKNGAKLYNSYCPLWRALESSTPELFLPNKPVKDNSPAEIIDELDDAVKRTLAARPVSPQVQHFGLSGIWPD